MSSLWRLDCVHTGAVEADPENLCHFKSLRKGPRRLLVPMKLFSSLPQQFLDPITQLDTLLTVLPAHAKACPGEGLTLSSPVCPSSC